MKGREQGKNEKHTCNRCKVVILLFFFHHVSSVLLCFLLGLASILFVVSSLRLNILKKKFTSVFGCSFSGFDWLSPTIIFSLQSYPLLPCFIASSDEIFLQIALIPCSLREFLQLASLLECFSSSFVPANGKLFSLIAYLLTFFHFSGFAFLPL